MELARTSVPCNDENGDDAAADSSDPSGLVAAFVCYNFLEFAALCWDCCLASVGFTSGDVDVLSASAFEPRLNPLIPQLFLFLPLCRFFSRAVTIRIFFPRLGVHGIIEATAHLGIDVLF